MSTHVDGAAPTEALEARGVKVHFAGVRAVDGVDLTLERGQILGLIGPNGAGKTTFMNALSGFVAVTEGTVAIEGTDCTRQSPQRLVKRGLVRTFQGVATFPDLTVFENVELGAMSAGLGRRKARERTWNLLEGLQLKHLARMYASSLPHGEERRVGIARAVACAPRFLLLDEPAAGLNDAESDALAQTIVRIRDENGCGVLLVEHDMRVIFGVCQRIQVLDYGKSVAAGTPEEVRKDRKVIEAYLGKEGADDVAESE
jgi:branched-chain amino acid transport system ATP-binding protein